MKIRKSASILLFYILIVSLFLTATYWGSRATSVIAQKIPMERKHTVIIDAGHGGEDGGATSCTGKLEKEYNLEIAMRLNDLMHLMGLHTKMVRTTDISVYTQGQTIAAKKVSDLKNRVNAVNETENGLLVSIHLQVDSFTGLNCFAAESRVADCVGKDDCIGVSFCQCDDGQQADYQAQSQQQANDFLRHK